MPDLEDILAGVNNNPYLVINYRHIPAPDEVLAAKVPPSHSTPTPGGISAEITVTWTAKSPVLVGGQKTSGGMLLPQCMFPSGPFCLPGASLRGMVKAAYMVATNSAFTPLNRKHGVFPKTNMFDNVSPKDNKGQPDKRQEYAVTRLKVYNSKNGNPETPNAYTTAISSMSTIAQVAARTYKDEPILDWATALFGFVKDDDNQDHWSRPINHDADALKSRVEFGFAVDEQDIGTLWPSTHLTIPGAGPKPTFEAGYLTNPEGENTGDLWSSSTAKLAGLKVYPVFALDPTHTKALEAHVDRKAGDMDTKLRFATKTQNGPLVFTGKIHCHNLHPLEFGALIWSLTLGEEAALSGRNGKNATHLHNIGHLKGYGMGLLEVAVTGGRVHINPTKEAPAGQVLEGSEFADFCIESMKAFLDGATMKTAENNRNRFLQYKNPNVGNKLRDAGYLKPIPPEMNPREDMALLGQKFTEIRNQKQVINRPPFVPEVEE